MKKAAGLILLGSLISGQAMAEGWYAGVGMGFVTFDDGYDTINPANLVLRGGYEINDYFDLGMESSVTIISDELDGFRSVDLDVNIFTIYARLKAPVNENFKLYAQIGQSNTELEASNNYATVSTDDDDTSIAFGAEFNVGDNKRNYIDLNFASYYDEYDIESSGVNIVYVFRF